MALQTGSYRFGSDNATLSVRTGRTGAAAKAGHNLLMHVTSWEATLVVADDPAGTSLELSADGASLQVIEGSGGVQALGDDDRESIKQTIDDEVLRRQPVTFRSTSAQRSADGGLRVEGDLTLMGKTRPIAFDVEVAEDGTLTAGTDIKQTDWGMKPYSTLFGALKVVDEVAVEVTANLRPPA